MGILINKKKNLEHTTCSGYISTVSRKGTRGENDNALERNRVWWQIRSSRHFKASAFMRYSLRMVHWMQPPISSSSSDSLIVGTIVQNVRSVCLITAISPPCLYYFPGWATLHDYRAFRSLKRAVGGQTNFTTDLLRKVINRKITYGNANNGNIIA